MILTIAAAFALFTGVNRVQALARERGAEEVARDAAPKTKKGGRVVIGEIVSTTAAKTAGPTVATVATTAVKPLQPLQVQAVEATATSPPAQNGCGQRVTYQAPLIVDGTPDTAWRVAGDGRGVKVTISLPQASKLSAVGIVPGYDKIDSCTNADRFVQMRRITRARWTFADGSTIEQTFQDARSMQVAPVDTITTVVTLEILATSGAPELDFTAISELKVYGVAA